MPSRKQASRWVRRSLAAGMAGLIVLNAWAFRHARSMMMFAPSGVRTAPPERLTLAMKARVLALGVTVPRPRTTLAPGDLAADCHRVSIPAPGGITLGAWYSRRAPDAPLVILFHGYSAEKSSLLPEAKAFLDLGASVLLVDFRGSGESSEAYTTIGYREADDVAASVSFARVTLGHGRVVLYGQSMGAAAILRAVHVNGVRPDAIIAEAVFDSLLNTIRHRFSAMGLPSFPCAELLVFWGGVQTGFNGFRDGPVDCARALACPSLFMHGTEDPRARIEDGRRVYEAARGPKRFHAFRSAGHESYVARFPDEWQATVSAFMAQVRSP